MLSSVKSYQNQTRGLQYTVVNHNIVNSLHTGIQDYQGREAHMVDNDERTGLLHIAVVLVEEERVIYWLTGQ